MVVLMSLFSIDNETAKRREDHGKTESETYIPHYVTTAESEQKPEKTKAEFDGDTEATARTRDKTWVISRKLNSRNIPLVKSPVLCEGTS